MLPVNIRMIFGGVTALAVGIVTGWIMLAEPSVEASEPAQVVTTVISTSTDRLERAPAAKPEPTGPAPPQRQAETPAAVPPAPVAGPVPPLRKAEAPPVEQPEPAHTVAPGRDTPGQAAPKNPGVRLVRSDDDDDDDDC